MDLAHGDAVGDDWLPANGIVADVGRVEELPMPQLAEAASVLVRGKHLRRNTGWWSRLRTTRSA